MSPKKATPAAVSAKKVVAPDTRISQQLQSSLRNYLIMLIGGTVVVALVGGYLAWQFMNQNIKKAREITAQEAYITMAKQRLDQSGEAEEALKKIKEVSNNQQSDFDLITKRALPTTADFSTNITVFSELQKQTGVEISSIGNGAKAITAAATPAGKAATATLPSGVSSYPMTLKISGKYSQIIDFIGRVEQSVRVFDFSSMKISGTSDQLALDMVYLAYYTEPVKLETQMVPLEEYLSQIKNDVEHYNK